MSATTSTTTDVAAALAQLLTVVPDVRVYQYVADSARVPCVVIGQPDVDFGDMTAGFCHAAWMFPVGIVVSRNNDRAAQAELSRLVAQVGNALAAPDTADLFSVEPLEARPVAVTVNGQDLPGYTMRVRVRA